MENLEDSVKGFLVTMTIIGIFITAILSFIVLFPQEQGVTFTDSSENSVYLTINDSKDLGLQNTLTTIDNSTTSGFDNWDITQGFMGSNTIKQGSSENVKAYSNNIFATLKTLATQVFGANSPVLWVIATLLVLSGSYLTYLVIKWIRTGL